MDYVAQANQYPVGSDQYNFWMNFANNPNQQLSPYQQQLIAASLPGGAAYSPPASILPSGPVVPGTNPNAIAGQPSGIGTAAFLPAPTVVSSSPSGGDQLQGTLQATPIVQAQPITMVQPAGAPSPTDTSTTTAPASFFSQTLLGFPIWLWLVAGVGGYFLFAGGQRGR